MKSLTLLYPDELVMKHVHKILSVNNFHVLSINRNNGSNNIQAIKKRAFRHDLLLDLKVVPVDSSITGIQLSVSPQHKANHPEANIEREEEHLLKTIQHLL
jgi:hypothetical protein